MTNTILVKKNEIALNGLADNKREFIARDGKKKDFFDVEDLNGELYHSKVINPGLFQQAPQVGLQNGVAYVCNIGEGPGDKGGGGGDKGSGDCGDKGWEAAAKAPGDFNIKDPFELPGAQLGAGLGAYNDCKDDKENGSSGSSDSGSDTTGEGHF
jgi:hypothetical protein